MLIREGCGAGKRSDMHRQCRWRKAAVLFPPLLRCGRALADEIGGGAEYQRIRIVVAQRIHFVQPSGQQYWKCNLVELHSTPVWVSVDPEALVETAVLALSTGEIDQRPEWQLRVA